MSFNFSVGTRNGKLAAIKAALDGGFLYIYAGPLPTNAEDALSGQTLLCKITESDDGSTGLTFAAPAAGAMTKTIAEDWNAVITASGTASYYRFCDASDTPANASATKQRLQGTLGVSGADLNLETVNLIANGTNKVGAGGFQVLED